VLDEGKHVIIDNTNLHPDYEKTYRELAKEYGYAFVKKDFTDIPLDVLIVRDAARGERSVGEKVIMDQYNRYLKPQGATFEKRPHRGLDYGPAVIVDLDGTLAHNDGHRRWHDYHKVYGDKLHKHVASAVDALSNKFDILLVSGRMGTEMCVAETLRWLRDYDIPFQKLFMREEGDFRTDAVVKKEIYEKYIDPHYDVEFVLDDRDQVVDMWRKELKIPTFQVNYGDF
jgi:hypothetical protein